MPYIRPEQRKKLDPIIAQLNLYLDTAGDCNYALCKIIDNYIRNVRAEGLSYESINAAIGILECAKLELYRRIAAKYEDKKKKMNGDVF